jgi:hypothetical protein
MYNYFLLLEIDFKELENISLLKNFNEKISMYHVWVGLR